MTKQKTTIQLHEKKLPTIQELYENTDLAIKQDAFMVFLNQDPPQSWVKKNPYAGNSLYIPVEKVEWLLRRLFKNPRFEIRQQGVMFNSCYTTVRIHYFDPVLNDWTFQDGTGASQIQTTKGSSPAEMQNIGQGAVEKALPDSYSQAIKNAAKKIGRIFGSDLNRDSPMPYTQDEKLQDVKRQKEIDRLRRLIEAAEQEQELAVLAEHVGNMADDGLNELFAEKQKAFEVEEGGGHESD